LPRPKKSFSPEFKDEAVKMVIETSRPIARVAKELGINEGTLGNWVGIYRREHAGEEPPLTVNERARLRELERETREQKMELEFLKKAAASPATIGGRQVRVHRRGVCGLPGIGRAVRAVDRENVHLDAGIPLRVL
jgi:transposase